MKFADKRTMTNLITFSLMLIMIIPLVPLPAATAHSPPWTFPTWCYVACINNVIGVGQATVIVFWISAVPPTAIGGYGDHWTFHLDITKPDGTNETLGPFISDPVGGSYTSYTPQIVGTYTIVARMDQHLITGTPVPPSGYSGSGGNYINDTFLGSASDPIKLTVQQEPIQAWSETPLPTEYWTRPINEANRQWSVLAGNWLAGAATNNGPTTRFSYGTGPESAHVMWTTPMWAGGIMDARFGDIGYETGHYEGTDFVPPIILQGKIYYNVYSLPREGWYCLDLYTGETEYFHNTTGPATGQSSTSSGSIAQESLAFGQILDFECPNQHGGFPYLWSNTAATANTWMMYDSITGNYICNIANVSASGTAVYGKDGSILRYNIVGSGANKRLTVWNTTQAIWWRGTQQQYQAGDYSGFSSNSYWMWRPGLNITYDGNHGFSLNASIPDVQGTIRAVREDQYVIGGTQGINNGTTVVQGNMWALNLKPDSNGAIIPTLLWNITFTPPKTVVPDIAAAQASHDPSVVLNLVDPEDGVFCFCEGATMQWWGYSLENGQQLWGPIKQSDQQMDFYSVAYGTFRNVYQGMLLTCGWGGVLTAYNITTGESLWNYTATQVGYESPYGNYPINICTIADGKLYLISGEHSITQPMWRGFLRCVNASNGAELWKILQFGADGGASLGGMYVVMADGYVVGLSQYDSQIYCYGKGPSATTVEAPMTGITVGSSAIIQGTVMDISAGTKQQTQAANFPNGVPAISDASQEAWMEYVYEQQAKPTNATGVSVSIDAVDPNGNFVHIGDATSDASGFYRLGVNTNTFSAGAGTYTIISTFAGSNSYYSSYAETAISITEAAPTASPYPVTAQPPTEMYIIGATVAIIIAIAIATIVIVLMNKKRS